MTFYPIPASPYRSSTGSMPLRVPQSSSPSRSKHEEKCEECGASYKDEHLLHLNTPFSTPPNQSASSLHPHSHSSHRRRTSNAGHEPPPASLDRYQHGTIYLEPASSYPHGSERRRRASLSAGSATASIPRSHARRSWSSYQHEIDISEDTHRRGTTRLPRKYVNKDAVKQMGLPFEEDSNGAILILKSLTRADIEHLVELTESIRSHRHHHSSQKKEKHVRIITQPTDEVAHPEDSKERYHPPPKTYVTGPPPPSGHYYVTSGPRNSSRRLTRAEEEAAAAEAKARHKEYRAEVSGSWIDSRRAAKAREEAEDKARIAEEIARKERTKREVVVVR